MNTIACLNPFCYLAQANPPAPPNKWGDYRHMSLCPALLIPSCETTSHCVVQADRQFVILLSQSPEC